MSRLSQVREYFKEHKEAFISIMRKELGLTHTQADIDIRELIKSGYIKSLEEPGLYAWVGEPKRNRKVQEKIWKAMRIAKNFSIRSLEVTTGASYDYIKRYVRHLKNNGYIRTIGKSKWPGQTANQTCSRCCVILVSACSVQSPRISRKAAARRSGNPPSG